MRIESLPVIMHFDYKNNNVTIEITEDFTYTNNKGKSWHFKKGWRSDGHSTGSLFKHFDAYTLAALCHDQDCERANVAESYKMRRKGDKSYRYNLKDLGAPKFTVWRRYQAVRGRTVYLHKITRKLK